MRSIAIISGAWAVLLTAAEAQPADALAPDEDAAPDAAGAEPVAIEPDPVAIEPDPIEATEPGGTLIRSVTQRVGLNVFGDASFAVRSSGKPKSTFELGAIGVIMNAEFTETLSAINEIAFEFVPDGTTSAPVADVERLQIQYNGGAIHVAAGRMHTELGYWNTAYHHGKWLQLPIERPRATQFEDDDGILPIHMVGVEASYTSRAGDGSVRWLAAVGNGRGAIEDDVRTLEDTNEMKSILVKAETSDVGARDLKLGLSAQIDRIAPAARAQHPSRSINELIGNAYAAYRGTHLTAIVEGYAVVHDDSDQRWTTLDGFAVVGWDVGRYVPFAQLEVRRAPSGTDPFYSPAYDPAAPDPAARSALADDLVEAVVGVRVDLSQWSVLKFAAGVEHAGDETVASAIANWSFGI